MLLLHISFQDQVTPWIIMAVGFVGVTLLNLKGRAGDALSYLRNANEILHNENLELKKERQILIAKTETLKAKTDVHVALMPLIQLMEKHEDESEKRFQNIMTMFALIAKTMGEEPNGADAPG